MADNLTTDQRRLNMSRIRSSDTVPEVRVRSIAHSMGYRFRLHRRDLAGKPDLTFPRMRKIVFVHGCFWHMHECRYGRVVPKTHADYWRAKRVKTKMRDKSQAKMLKKEGWRVLTVWECETRKPEALARILRTFLNN
jgi:DNA mismatch endonuclease (patch repair protein)